MQRLGVTTYYIKRNHYLPPHSNLYETVAPLLQQQGFETEPTSGEYEWGKFEPGLQYDYDIDSFRTMPFRNVVHIMVNMAMKFGVSKHNLFSPWLHNINPVHVADNLIHLTERWREGSKVNWNNVRSSISGSCAFIGFKHEHDSFQKLYGGIEWVETQDLLEMAQVIAGAKRLYCNQSVALVCAQGLGKEYWLEKKPGKQNVIMKVANENLL